jgi:hypothetical protein
MPQSENSLQIQEDPDFETTITILFGAWEKNWFYSLSDSVNSHTNNKQMPVERLPITINCVDLTSDCQC